MAIDKKIDYKIQGGVKNYKPSEMVSVPKIAKSSPDTPTAKLAYITPEEEKILIDLNLYGSLKGKPNRGPGGIPSLEGDFGSPTGQASTGAGTGGTYSGGGGDYSSAETGNFSGFDGTGGTELPPGVNPTPSKEAQAIRNSFIAAGGGQRVNPGFFDSRNTVSPVELAMAKASNPSAFNKVRGGGITNFITGGGFIGAGIRGLGNMFGLGKTYDQPTNDMSGYNSLGLGGTGQEGFGVPTQQGDYDMLGNKINEITGEITSPTGQSLGTIPGYPGGPGSDGGGITTLPQNGSDQYVNLIDQYVPDDPAIPNDAFSQRFKVKDEFRKAKGNDLMAEDKAIQKMIEELYT